MQPDILRDPPSTLSSQLEVGAYEYLWDKHVSSYKQLNELRDSYSARSLQEVTGQQVASEFYQQTINQVSREILDKMTITPCYSDQYPSRLNDARHPAALLYSLGDFSLINQPSLAIVGSRKASSEGLRRARKVAFLLAKRGYTIISGLATGIDRAAHLAALEANARTIAVLGTPIDRYYPKQNIELQNEIARNHLVVSSVPFVRHKRGTPKFNRIFFPERNKLMSSISLGTIIVEAGETSGTLVQARAALEQGRKLYILQSCFENQSISWPKNFERMGAIRVRDINDIESRL